VTVFLGSESWRTVYGLEKLGGSNTEFLHVPMNMGADVDGLAMLCFRREFEILSDMRQISLGRVRDPNSRDTLGINSWALYSHAPLP